MNSALLLLVVAFLGGSAALSVIIRPEWEHVRRPDTSLTVRCVADEPISHCQFRVAYSGVDQNVDADLSLGRRSNVSHFKYEGDGLLAGHCGATIGPAVLPNLWHSTSVICRVRKASSDWVYATMSVTVSAHPKIPLTIASRLVVVRPGEDVNLLFVAGEPLGICQLKHPRHQGWMHLPPRQICGNETDSICYHSRGPSQEQCGVTIKKITSVSNGMYWFKMKTSTDADTTHVQVIVTKPPRRPVLSASTVLHADGTTIMTALCVVVGSRPAAEISWVLGGKVVTGGKIFDLPDDRWVMQYDEQNTIQQLTLNIDAVMIGLDLSCVVRHVALPSLISSNKVKILVPCSQERSPASVSTFRGAGAPQQPLNHMDQSLTSVQTSRKNSISAREVSAFARENAVLARENAVLARENAVRARERTQF